MGNQHGFKCDLEKIGMLEQYRHLPNANSMKVHDCDSTISLIFSSYNYYNSFCRTKKVCNYRKCAIMGFFKYWLLQVLLLE